MRNNLLLAITASFLLLSATGRFSSAQESAFENLGKPVPLSIPIEFVTVDREGRSTAWANFVESSFAVTDTTRRALVGVRVDTGKLVTVDLFKYGLSPRTLVFKRDDNTLYLYAGRPGRFLKYDVGKNQLSEVSPPVNATYWLSGSQGPDGKIYVGTYPDAGVSVLDPVEDRVEHIVRVSPDTRQQYVTLSAASDDNIIYFSTGMHHSELWALNADTGEKRQILTAEMMKIPGAPRVWTGTDGEVYGRLEGYEFLCKPDKVIIGETMAPRQDNAKNIVNGKSVVQIDARARLVLEDVDSAEKTLISTQFEVPGASVYSIGDVLNGKLYGGSHSPGRSFTFDIETKELKDLGRLTRGTVQVYDTLAYGNGLYLSSYPGGFIDYYDPAQPIEVRKNPRPIAELTKTHMQERVVQLAVGPDDKVYSVSSPVKGYLGGALIQINPQDNTTKVWRDIVPNQSQTSVVSIPETKELFVTCSIYGGSSAVPTEKEAGIFLWDTQQEKISFRAQPITGAIAYHSAMRALNGIIYGFAGTKYYAFDPVRRETIFVGDLPVMDGAEPAKRAPFLADKPIGPQGMIYGVDSAAGTIFEINPKDHSVRIVAHDNSLRNIGNLNVTTDGVLYYGVGPNLMRYQLPK